MFQSLLRGVGQVTVPLYIVAATVFGQFLPRPDFHLRKSGVPALGVMELHSPRFWHKALPPPLASAFWRADVTPSS